MCLTRLLVDLAVQDKTHPSRSRSHFPLPRPICMLCYYTGSLLALWRRMVPLHLGRFMP